MRALIVSGGAAPSFDLIKEEMYGDYKIICADSGANCLYSYNIVPDFLIGDFDSISQNVLNYYKESKVVIENYPKDKDYTDTQIALSKAIELGAEEVVFLGCTGTRIDHTLGNIGLLLECLKINISACIKDNNNKIMLTDKSIGIDGYRGQYFSLVSFGGPVKDLTIKGAKFPLTNHYLQLGDPLTLSNEFLESKVEIDFTDGILLIIYGKD